MTTVEVVCCTCLSKVPVTVGEKTCEVLRRRCPHCETVMIVRVRAGRWVSTRKCGHSVPVAVPIVPLSPSGME